MPEPGEWPAAALDPRLEDGEIQVWLAMLDVACPEPASFGMVLAPDEQERAGRFAFPRDRRRFVAARVLLRRILACYLETDPQDVQFSYDHYGKPSVAGYPTAPSFNVSHSQEAAVFAISRAGEVGVDIEALRPLRDAEDIAARFFSPREIEALRSLPPAERERAFFNCWTRKEAFVKAVGQGLSHPLDSFSVTLRPGEPVHVVHDGPTQSDALSWTLAELPGVAGYVGALAVRGHPRAIHYRAWNESVTEPALAIRVP